MTGDGMSNKWTPLPWEIVSEFVGPLKVVATVDASIDRSGRMEVAYVGADTFATCQANARLISAAPDMAEALDSLLMAIELPGNHCELAPAVERARLALKKARGEE